MGFLSADDQIMRSKLLWLIVKVSNEVDRHDGSFNIFLLNGILNRDLAVYCMYRQSFSLTTKFSATPICDEFDRKHTSSTISFTSSNK